MIHIGPIVIVWFLITIMSFSAVLVSGLITLRSHGIRGAFNMIFCSEHLLFEFMPQWIVCWIGVAVLRGLVYAFHLIIW